MPYSVQKVEMSRKEFIDRCVILEQVEHLLVCHKQRSPHSRTRRLWPFVTISGWTPKVLIAEPFAVPPDTTDGFVDCAEKSYLRQHSCPRSHSRRRRDNTAARCNGFKAERHGIGPPARMFYRFWSLPKCVLYLTGTPSVQTCDTQGNGRGTKHSVKRGRIARSSRLTACRQASDGRAWVITVRVENSCGSLPP